MLLRSPRPRSSGCCSCSHRPSSHKQTPPRIQVTSAEIPRSPVPLPETPASTPPVPRTYRSEPSPSLSLPLKKRYHLPPCTLSASPQRLAEVLEVTGKRSVVT